MTAAADIANALHGTRSGNGWTACCPAHDDRNPSLSISDSERGPLIHCHAGCSQDAVIDELKARGLWANSGAHDKQPHAPDTHPQLGEPLRFWDYHSATGAHVARVFRWNTSTGKTIRQASLQNGAWCWKALPDDRPLYRLPELLANHGKPVLICEGEKATDAAALIFLDHICVTWSGGAKALGKTNLSPLRGRTVTLWPDADEPGQEAMRELHTRLQSLGCDVRIVDLLTLGELPPGWDLADAKPSEAETLRACLESANEKPKPRYTLMTGAELAQLPPLAWLIKYVLPREGIAAIFGPSGSGKTFAALDAACAIAEGSSWFSCATKQSDVVYVGLEGEAGLKLRCDAWAKHRGRPLPAALRFVLRQSFDLTAPQDVSDLAEVCPPGGVVIIDTLNRAAPLCDENAARDMGTILSGAKRLQALTSGLVVLVHHTGKDSGRGLRGHSSLHAALDAAIEVTAEGDARHWSCYKSKDAAGDARHGFRLDPVELGFDDDGDRITSCVVAPTECEPHANGSGPKLSKDARLAQRVFEEIAPLQGEFGGGQFRGVQLEVWRAAFYARHVGDNTDAKRKAFQRARNALDDAGLIKPSGDVYQLAGPLAGILTQSIEEKRL